MSESQKRQAWVSRNGAFDNIRVQERRWREADQTTGGFPDDVVLRAAVGLDAAIRAFLMWLPDKVRGTTGAHRNRPLCKR